MEKFGFTDSYDKTRTFPGPTWSPFSYMPSLIRIDYIFCNDLNRIQNSYTRSISGSDHRMVVTDFIPKK